MEVKQLIQTSQHFFPKQTHWKSIPRRQMGHESEQADLSRPNVWHTHSGSGSICKTRSAGELTMLGNINRRSLGHSDWCQQDELPREHSNRLWKPCSRGIACSSERRKASKKNRARCRFFSAALVQKLADWKLFHRKHSETEIA